MRIKFRRKSYCCILISVVMMFLLYEWLTLLPTNSQPYEDPLLVKGNVLCVLVPYRDRFEELQQFIPHMENFLSSQNVDHRFIILNQTDSLRFNRASLINVGWLEADRLRCNYLVMHDVDLLPQNPALDYTYPGIGIVRHIAAGKYHPKKRYDYAKFIGGILILTMEDYKLVNGMSNKYWGWGLEDDEFYLRLRYDYAKFIGGILILTMEDYKLVNGMSNKYWGWGLEDDEFYLRLRDANLLEHLQRPDNLNTSRGDTFLHVHDAKKRARDQIYTPLQKQMSHRRDRTSGLFSVNYMIADRQLLKIEGITALVINIELICDRKWTPYCTLD
uniref:Beta-1,4-N-acetylgalactosaminyltransferase n=1 Tax=Panagrolaimus sp. ES5 TaxID=591445 RepID=A0AC34GVR3_9BILA